MKVLIAIMPLAIVAYVAATEMRARTRLYLNDNYMADHVEIGVLHFTQSSSDEPIKLTGEIEGLPPGHYLLVLHAKRARRLNCNSLGPKKSLNSTHLLPELLSIVVGNQEVTKLSGCLDDITLMPNQVNSMVGHQVGLYYAAGYDRDDEYAFSHTSLACGYVEVLARTT